MRIALREYHLDMKDSSFVESLLGASDIGMPNKDVIIEGPSCDSNSGDFFFLDFTQILNESLLREGEIFFVDGCPQQSLIS